jgi:quinol monooxygenase YgiN
MVQLVLRLRVPPDRASDVVEALRAVMSAARWHPGWAHAQVDRDLDDPRTLHYREEWLTPEDTAREVGSDRFSRLLELMEAATEPPDLRFQFVSEVRGLDYVAEVRGDQNPGVARPSASVLS